MKKLLEAVQRRLFSQKEVEEVEEVEKTEEVEETQEPVQGPSEKELVCLVLKYLPEKFETLDELRDWIENAKKGDFIEIPGHNLRVKVEDLISTGAKIFPACNRLISEKFINKAFINYMQEKSIPTDIRRKSLEFLQELLKNAQKFGINIGYFTPLPSKA